MCCDLFILRRITAALRGTPLGDDLAGSIDQSALDLVSSELLSELDYGQEAVNAQRFRVGRRKQRKEKAWFTRRRRQCPFVLLREICIIGCLYVYIIPCSSFVIHHSFTLALH